MDIESCHVIRALLHSKYPVSTESHIGVTLGEAHVYVHEVLKCLVAMQ